MSQNVHRKLRISTHMPLARHDGTLADVREYVDMISTHMPLARHDPLSSNIEI